MGGSYLGEPALTTNRPDFLVGGARGLGATRWSGNHADSGRFGTEWRLGVRQVGGGRGGANARLYPWRGAGSWRMLASYGAPPTTRERTGPWRRPAEASWNGADASAQGAFWTPCHR